MSRHEYAFRQLQSSVDLIELALLFCFLFPEVSNALLTQDILERYQLDTLVKVRCFRYRKGSHTGDVLLHQVYSR